MKTDAELYRESWDTGIKEGSTWKHVKTNDEYQVQYFVVRESDCVICVVYAKTNTYTPVPWCRPVSEFLDGRFVKISDNS